MDGLRWLLLLLGALVIAGVYFYSRRERASQSEKEAPGKRVAPTLEESPGEEAPESVRIPEIDSPEFELREDEAPPQIEETSQEQNQEQGQEQKIVTCRLIARDGGAFKGDELILSLRGIGLRHGKFGIFHRYDGNDEDRTVFSAASLVEPGSFDIANIKDQEIPGISLFLVLPGPIDSVEAFDMMMDAARTLAQSLGAELLDESGSSLSIQRERYMREEVIQFQHSNLVA